MNGRMIKNDMAYFKPQSKHWEAEKNQETT
jgi:hypothetical protein